MEYGIDKNIIINDKQVKKVTDDLNNSEETVSLLRLEVLELQKQNKEKQILIEDLSFKVETINQILEDNTCSNCKDTGKLKSELSHMRTMYDDLLEEHSKSIKLIIQHKIDKELKETMSCKHCSFKFLDHQILKDHRENEHYIKPNLYNLTFNSKQVLHKHELLSHVKIQQAKENMFKCNFCNSVSSDGNTLMTHIKRDHKIRCNKYHIEFKDQESKNTHAWDYHSK